MNPEPSREAETSSYLTPYRRWVYLAGGLFLGGVFLYITGRGIDLNETVAAIYAIDPRWLLPLILAFTFSVICRCWRWQHTFPHDLRPSLRHAIDAFLIGRIGNTLMPGRLGEMLRAGVMGKLCPRIGVSGSLATIVVEKTFDIFAILALFGIAVLYAPLPQWLVGAGITLIVTIAGLLLILWIIDRLDGRYNTLAMPVPSGGLRQKIAGFLFGTLSKFTSGLYAFRTVRQSSFVGALTLVIWSGDVVIFYLCMQAFSVPVPFMAAVVSVVFFSVGSILPAAPGFIGTYQLFIVAALQLYAVSENTAFAVSIFLNVFIIVMTLIYGSLALLLDGGLFGIRKMFFATSK